MTSSAPVSTQYSYEFVRRSLPTKTSRVVEVGCGSGELAARFATEGLQLVALDSDENCIAEARARGVDAHVVTWPSDLTGRFDAVLFTRSLHHIQDLEGAVAAAVRVLRPHGRVIVEDFRSEGGSPRGTAWFKGTVKLLHSSGGFRPEFDLDQTLAKTETVDHEQPLHSSTAIAQALAAAGSVETEDSACYFRYLESEFRTSALTRAFFQYELDMIANNAIDPLGKRFVLAP